MLKNCNSINIDVVPLATKMNLLVYSADCCNFINMVTSRLFIVLHWSYTVDHPDIYSLNGNSMYMTPSQLTSFICIEWVVAAANDTVDT